MSALPDFMIIGASRCGTTSLHMMLGEHPVTIPPAVGKELNFFDLQYDDCPIDWYVKCWPVCDTPGMLRYESSTDYLFDPVVPARVHFWMPDCKFIVMLRNPVERAWSEYYNYWIQHFKVGISEFKRLLSDVTYDTPEKPLSPYTAESKYRIVQKGIYVKSLKRWFELFPNRKQFLIIKAERFFTDCMGVLDDISDFLSISFAPGTPTVGKYDILRDPRRPYPDMPPKLRAAYAEYYKPHNEALYAFLGRNFGWQ